MTRLFIRFYFGVLAALFLALVVQGIMYQYKWLEGNTTVVEDSLAGGAHFARAQLEAAPEAERTKRLEELSALYRHPIEIIDRSSPEISARASKRLDAGIDPVWDYEKDKGSILYSPLPEHGKVLRHSHLPEFKQPSGKRQLIGLFVVLCTIAVLSLLAVRPIVRQLRAIEEASFAIAGGDLGARIDEGTVRSGHQVARAFNSMADRVTTLLRTQKELLQAVSHELRTPLARIRFGIELLSSTIPESERNQQQLELIDDAIQELDDLVEELLQYVRLETAERPFELERFDVLDLLASVLKQVSTTFPDISFTLAEPEEGPNTKPGEGQPSRPELEAQPRAFQQAIRNLLLNAGRHAKSQVRLSLKMDGGKLLIDVDDDGPGVPVADRVRIFKPFVRLEQQSPGVGLGLALVDRILNRHGGHAEALASPSGGCRIRTEWPMTEPVAPAARLET